MPVLLLLLLLLPWPCHARACAGRPPALILPRHTMPCRATYARDTVCITPCACACAGAGGLSVVEKQVAEMENALQRASLHTPEIKEVVDSIRSTASTLSRISREVRAQQPQGDKK